MAFNAGVMAKPSTDPLSALSWVWRFESDQITGLSDGDLISTWPDISGNGRNATGVSTTRPTYKTNILNGQPVARFSGAADIRMTTPAISAISMPTTIFVVASHTASSFSQIFDGLGTSNRHALFASTSDMEMFAGASSNGGAKSSGTVRIIQCRFNTTASGIRIGGGTLVGSGNTGTQTLTGLTIGNRFASSFSSAGDIAALLVANSDLSLTNVNLVGNYLAAKYGLTWSTAT